MIGRLHWIDGGKLARYILQCQVCGRGALFRLYTDFLQDTELGGLADRPGDMVDVFHTAFGLAGLSLLEFPGLEEVHPV